MRQCGTCTLCCRLLPVRPLGKVAGQRCTHQRHTGCRVYNKPAMPPECSLWNCRWLVNNAGDTSRPDRSHIVIDLMPDFIDLRDDDSGKTTQIEVIQCWCDPKYPDAHRDPAFRAFAFAQALEGRAILIRYDASRAFTLFAPPFAADDQWHEVGGDSIKRDHTFREIAETLSSIG